MEVRELIVPWEHLASTYAKSTCDKWIYYEKDIKAGEISILHR